MLLGKDIMDKIKETKVAVYGVGGVGSFAVEGLVRSGIGSIILIDGDVIGITNINRQIHATTSTVGKLKVEVLKERILDINPCVNVIVHNEFFKKNNADSLFDTSCNYIIDAIDSVKDKTELIVMAKKTGISIISSMGAGNKLDPLKFEVTDIYNTSVCPLAKVMRKRLRKRGIKSLKVVYSKELPLKTAGSENKNKFSRNVTGSISYVPSTAGLIIAGEVIKDICKKH